jgi:hypothetical protein
MTFRQACPANTMRRPSCREPARRAHGRVFNGRHAGTAAVYRSRYQAGRGAEGDVDTVVAIYAAELDDRGRNHLRIASELDGADRGDEALRWAERGLREAAHPDQQLADYLPRRHALAGRDDDVLSLRRDRFKTERTLTSYQALRQAATISGVWPGSAARRSPSWAKTCAIRTAGPPGLGVARS